MRFNLMIMFLEGRGMEELIQHVFVHIKMQIPANE